MESWSDLYTNGGFSLKKNNFSEIIDAEMSNFLHIRHKIIIKHCFKIKYAGDRIYTNYDYIGLLLSNLSLKIPS